jgi:hypothetical protein
LLQKKPTSVPPGRSDGLVATSALPLKFKAITSSSVSPYWCGELQSYTRIRPVPSPLSS